MPEGPTEEGFVNYLIYLVVTLMAGFFTFVQRAFHGRLKTVEEKCDNTVETIHTMETTLTEKITASDKEWHDKFEARRLENKEDFKGVHTKIDTTHASIIEELKKLEK